MHKEQKQKQEQKYNKMPSQMVLNGNNSDFLLHFFCPQHFHSISFLFFVLKKFLFLFLVVMGKQE